MLQLSQRLLKEGGFNSRVAHCIIRRLSGGSRELQDSMTIVEERPASRKQPDDLQQIGARRRVGNFVKSHGIGCASPKLRSTSGTTA